LANYSEAYLIKINHAFGCACDQNMAGEMSWIAQRRPFLFDPKNGQEQDKPS
jgi:hypothetical protein